MDKKEYIIRQLGRTKNKKYEAYVVSRIIHLLNDFDIKFVTQQYVTRPKGRALTDLFFPQVNLHVEVDEPHHKNCIEEDKIREADIVNATNHEIMRVDVSKPIDEINSQVHEIVERVQSKITQLKTNDLFTPWNIDSEVNPESYIKRGYIDISDNVAFKNIKDACNCFGHNYDGYQSSLASHPDSDTVICFMKLYPNNEWINNISPDEETITERNKDDEKAKEHIDGFVKQSNGHKHKRIVFAHVKDNLGDRLYRFRGLYELNIENSKIPIGLIWQRKKTRVITYPHNTTRIHTEIGSSINAESKPETIKISKIKAKASIRTNPIKFLSKNFPELLYTKRTTSRMHESKEMRNYLDNWWFNFDLDYLKSNEFIVFVGALDYENRSFKVFKVPSSYLLQNIDKIDTNDDGWINLYVHIEKLIDIRNKNNLSFSKFLLN